MEKKTFKREDLKKGQELTYTGTGFLGYEKGNNKMIFVEIDKRYYNDIIVKYVKEHTTLTISVTIYEVQP